MEQDPIVMYIVVKQSDTINMSTGKICAQVGHGVMMCALEYQHQNTELINSYPSSNEERVYHDWLSSDYRKVVLRANDKEFEKIKTEYEDSLVLIQDAGRTEIPAGSETVIGLFPQYKSKVTSTLKRLQLL